MHFILSEAKANKKKKERLKNKKKNTFSRNDIKKKKPETRVHEKWETFVIILYQSDHINIAINYKQNATILIYKRMYRVLYICVYTYVSNMIEMLTIMISCWMWNTWIMTSFKDINLVDNFQFYR